MLRRLVALLPPRVIRFFGRLQWVPVIGPVVRFVGTRLVSGRGTMKYGVGAGLQFDATGLAPGFVLGTTDPLEQEALTRYLLPGGVFYDIGANVGFFCVLAARLVGDHGKVYAFEPHPKYAARLRANAAANGFTWVEVVEAAASDADGETTLNLEGLSCPSIAFGAAGQGVRVPTVTVDRLIRERGFRPPRYVVIDAEGAEMRVLSGMLDTLRTHRPVVLTEVHWLGREFEEFIDRHVRPLGYTMRTLDGRPVRKEKVRYHALLLPPAE
jgi:FkbM family methyltransferase